jgi:hypothetical protein
MTFRDKALRQWRYFAMWSGWITQPRVFDIEGAVPFSPPPVYRVYHEWLLRAFDAAGVPTVHRNFDAIAWYTAPLIPKRLIEFTGDGRYDKAFRLWGIWLRAERAIVLLHTQVENATLVRHEMTHDIRDDGLHVLPHFDPKFWNVV